MGVPDLRAGSENAYGIKEGDVDQPLGITFESLAPDTVCVALSGELDF